MQDGLKCEFEEKHELQDHVHTACSLMQCMGLS